MLRVTSLFRVFFREASLRVHVKILVLAVNSLLTVKSQSITTDLIGRRNQTETYPLTQQVTRIDEDWSFFSTRFVETSEEGGSAMRN